MKSLRNLKAPCPRIRLTTIRTGVNRYAHSIGGSELEESFFHRAQEILERNVRYLQSHPEVNSVIIETPYRTSLE